MEYVKTNDLDINNGFFHFTRIDNRESIQEHGLMAVAGGENPAGSDIFNKTIYFAKGVKGMLEAIDVWARWEYEGYVWRSNNRINHGFQGYDENTMLLAYEKMYLDFKDRIYYLVDFKEGKDRDFEYGDIDIKKATDLRDKQGRPYSVPEWMYGPYSNWGTTENQNNEQEIWNMNTKIGERTIPTDRLKIIETEKGRTDALSIILEMYDRYRGYVKHDQSWMYEILDNFITYAKERMRKDKDYSDGMPDIGRRKINPAKQEELQRINKITPQDIAHTTINYMQKNPGTIAVGVKEAGTILNLEEKDINKTFTE